jgi:threonine/homoserine/homoserine lactone efflux protein
MDSVVGIAVTSFLVGLSGAMMPGPVLTITIGETARRLKGDRPEGGRHGDAAPVGCGPDGTPEAGRRAQIRGALVGPLIVSGHAVLEILLVAGVVLGLGRLLVLGPVIGVIGLVGGAVLVWMALGMLRGLGALTLSGNDPAGEGRPRLVLAGILTSLSNPYWTIWWATIGLGYIALSLQLGFVGLLSFYVGHILSDLAWYSSISLTLAMGHRLLTDRVYRGLVAVCACFLLGFGLYFGYAGVKHLVA